jgi:hypothetical protein
MSAACRVPRASRKTLGARRRDVPAAVNTVEESLKAFVHTLLHDEEPPITAVDGLLTLEIAEGAALLERHRKV